MVRGVDGKVEVEGCACGCTNIARYIRNCIWIQLQKVGHQSPIMSLISLGLIKGEEKSEAEKHGKVRKCSSSISAAIAGIS